MNRREGERFSSGSHTTNHRCRCENYTKIKLNRNWKKKRIFPFSLELAPVVLNVYVLRRLDRPRFYCFNVFTVLHKFVCVYHAKENEQQKQRRTEDIRLFWSDKQPLNRCITNTYQVIVMCLSNISNKRCFAQLWPTEMEIIKVKNSQPNGIERYVLTLVVLFFLSFSTNICVRVRWVIGQFLWVSFVCVFLPVFACTLQNIRTTWFLVRIMFMPKSPFNKNPIMKQVARFRLTCAVTETI